MHILCGVAFSCCHFSLLLLLPFMLQWDCSYTSLFFSAYILRSYPQRRLRGKGCTEQEDLSWCHCSCCRKKTKNLEGRLISVRKRFGVRRVWMKGRTKKTKAFAVLAGFGDWKDGKLRSFGLETKRIGMELHPRAHLLRVNSEAETCTRAPSAKLPGSTRKAAVLLYCPTFGAVPMPYPQHSTHWKHLPESIFSKCLGCYRLPQTAGNVYLHYCWNNQIFEPT